MNIFFRPTLKPNITTSHKMLNFLGKLLIATSLCLQAFVLYSDASTATAFNSQANDMIKSWSHLPYQTLLPFLPHLRYLTCGLLTLSALMVFTRITLIKFLVLVGLIINLFVVYNPLKKLPGFNHNDFWQDIAIIGGVIYLMGADVGKPVVGQPVVT